MRTALAFFFGAALVSATWVVAGPSRPTGVTLDPAVDGPPVLDGLGEPVVDFGWRGAGDEAGRLSDLLGQGPVVVAIRDLRCTVSQRYGATLHDLETEYAERGVGFLYVDLTPAEVGWSLPMARDQAELTGTYVRHVGDDFFEALHPTTSTEVFLIDASGVLRYRGAIDDQFGVDFARQAPGRRFLADAIEAALQERIPAVGATFAPGSYLRGSAAPPERSRAESPPPVTYARDIQPLLEENCVSCHSTGGPGPFRLDAYDAVVANREEILSVVARNRMPPWPANPQVGSWANDPRLTGLEKRRLLGWIEAGMPLGDPVTSPPVEAAAHDAKEIPSDRTTPEGGLADEASAAADPAREGWRHGTPDAVVAMQEPFTIEAGDELSLMAFYIPTDFAEDRWVSGVEILPSAQEAVVQAVVLLESPDTPAEDRSFGLEGFFAGYAAGSGGGSLPPGTAKRLPAGAWLKLLVHYRAQPVPTEDRTRIGLTFTEAPRGPALETRSAYATGFEIPSHASNHAVTAEHYFPVGGVIHSFRPQMHLRGSAIRYVLVEPSGEEQTLLDIPRYYFQFRFSYVAANPIRVEAGSTLRVTGWYDNSEANMANPDPSVSASFGSQLTDELMIGYFDFVPDGPRPETPAAPPLPDR